MVRARAVLELADALDTELEATRQATALLRDLELPLVGVLAGMERTGIAVDTDHLARARGALRRRGEGRGRRGLRRDRPARSTSARPSSCRCVLFDELGMPKTKRTKTGYTTDADALQALFAQTGHPFLEALLRHRDASRLKVTVDGLLKTVADDGRIHTTYNQIIAATGRLSSTDPNLQNIPIRTEEGRRIREAFVVGAGYESLMTADYSQIEMRIMAHLSEDAGADRGVPLRGGPARVHRVRGCSASSPGTSPSSMRAKIKAMSYGLAYGLSRVRPVPPARHRHRRGQGPDGRVLPAVRRGPRLPAATSSPRRAAPASPRRSSAAAATCPT